MIADLVRPADHDSRLVAAHEVDLIRGSKMILSGANATVRRGEIVTLIGPNGAGKTTLVRVILGLEKPDRGSIFRCPGLRVGYMPQRLVIDPALPMTVRRFVTLAVSHRGTFKRTDPLRTLDEVGAKRLVDSSIHDISGGELQRVMLARALVRDPDLLVLDEPAQGVDVTGQADLYRLIGRIRDERGCGVLLVSHDLHLVMAATDHVICLNHHVCCAGRPEAVARDPNYRALFGEQVARAFAVYHHDHDHRHDADGAVLPLRKDDNKHHSGEAGHG